MRARLLVAALLLLPGGAVATEHTRAAVFVANAEDGTVSVIDAATFAVVRTLVVVPDGASASPQEDPFHTVSHPLVSGAAGENLAQDLDVSPDGRVLYVSRGHRGDVAAFDLVSGGLLWHAPVSGFRADHMALSDDGARLFVSALTENKVEVFDTADGRFIGYFRTGEWPHDVVVHGARVYNGSLGNILLPEEVRGRRPAGPPEVTPPPYVLTVADASTLIPLRSIPFDRGIRPFVITSDETRLYAQLSEFHGIVEHDLATGARLRTLELPVAPGVTSDDYDFEAPHHGLALSGDEQYLCVAGRASDYVAIVSRATLAVEAIVPVDDAPGWAETDTDGEHCWVPSTRANTVSVISFATLEKVAEIPVGLGPKYVASAVVPASVLG